MGPRRPSHPADSDTAAARLRSTSIRHSRALTTGITTLGNHDHQRSWAYLEFTILFHHGSKLPHIRTERTIRHIRFGHFRSCRPSVCPCSACGGIWNARDQPRQRIGVFIEREPQFEVIDVVPDRKMGAKGIDAFLTVVAWKFSSTAEIAKNVAVAYILSCEIR